MMLPTRPLPLALPLGMGVAAGASGAGAAMGKAARGCTQAPTTGKRACQLRSWLESQ